MGEERGSPQPTHVGSAENEDVQDEMKVVYRLAGDGQGAQDGEDKLNPWGTALRSSWIRSMMLDAKSRFRIEVITRKGRGVQNSIALRFRTALDAEAEA